MPTYCRICEPQCGLIALVRDGRLVSVGGNPLHVHSQGFSCPKSRAAADIVYDPDRVLVPLRRTGGPGEFTPVTWAEAMDDIAGRLRSLRTRHGPAALATFLGNPPAFSHSAALGLAGFQDAAGVKWRYGVNSEDGAARTAANSLLYGSCAFLLQPDLWSTHLAVLIGTNPYVSHGSGLSEPRIFAALESITARGGRVIVVDPRRTETARRFEHIAVRGGSDAYLLLGIIGVLVTDGLVDAEFVTRHTTGMSELAALTARFPPDYCAPRCGVPADVITELARAIASAESATVFGRTGTCTQRFGTLNNMLQDLIVVLTGNLERRGGLLFGWGAIDMASFAQKAGLDTLGATHSRTTGAPDVNGMLPSTSLAPDITTPGDQRVRALIVVGANPVLSSPDGGDRLAHALSQLDLHVSLDLYVNETNKGADYVLPVTSMFERNDVPLLAMSSMLRPSAWATRAVIAPRGQVRTEFAILHEIAKRIGVGGAYSLAPLRALARLGINVSPTTLVDVMLRTGPAGDLFGVRRSGISVKKLLRDHPHGRTLRPEVPIKDLRRVLKTPDRRVAICPPELRSEVHRLLATAEVEADPDPRYPLRMIGMRESRSQNTWMHNVTRLMPDRREHRVRINPRDAEAAGVASDAKCRIVSATGSVCLPMTQTTDMVPGTIAMPHGWGHHGGWQRANAAGGVNSNDLASARSEDLEGLVAMSVLNGIPVRIEPVE